MSIIYSIIVVLAHLGEKRDIKNLSSIEKSNVETRVSYLDDQWPFRDTLKQNDPYISDLLSDLTN